jgi:hypothetical protein
LWGGIHQICLSNLKNPFSLFDVPDLGEIVQAKLDFCGIGRGVGPNTVNQTPDIPNPTLLTTAVKSEVLEEL